MICPSLSDFVRVYCNPSHQRIIYTWKFFLRLLSAESCQSRLIATSQDLPVKFHSKAARYSNFYQRHILYGLDKSEQEALFEIEGLDVNQKSEERPIWLRLGKAYKGHPLVLRVIIGEINSHPFNGNVQAYWNDVGSKIEEVEQDLAEAEAGKTEGYDEWELHKLSRQVRDKLNKERLKAVFNSLKTQVPDAYTLICAASVYRIPVQEEGWLMQLAALVRRVEFKENLEAESSLSVSKKAEVNTSHTEEEDCINTNPVTANLERVDKEAQLIAARKIIATAYYEKTQQFNLPGLQEEVNQAISEVDAICP